MVLRRPEKGKASEQTLRRRKEDAERRRFAAEFAAAEENKDTPLPFGMPKPPQVKPAVSPTVPPFPSIGMLPSTPPTVTRTGIELREGDNETTDMYNAMMQTITTGLIAGIETQTFDGQTLYKSAPLGYQGAITKVVVTLDEVDPFTGRGLTETWFQIDPSLKPKDPFEAEIMRLSALSQAIPGLGSKRLQNIADQLGQIYGSQSPYIGPEDVLYGAEDADRLLKSIASNVNDLALLKSNLIKTGFLLPKDAGPLNFVYLDDKVFDAFRKLVDVAQSNDIKYDSFLKTMVDGGMSVSSSEPSRTFAPIRVTSSEDLRQIANRVAQSQIGRRLEDNELENFSQAYQSLETQFQRKMMGGGVVESPPDAGVMAERMIGEELSTETDLYSLGSTLDMFTKLLGGV